jgi:hypothetical protein
MLNKILLAITISSWLACLITWLYATYHWIHTLGNTRPGMLRSVLFNPVGFFTASYFTEKGNHHRKRTLIAVLIFLLTWSVGLLCLRLQTNIGG